MREMRVRSKETKTEKEVGETEREREKEKEKREEEREREKKKRYILRFFLISKASRHQAAGTGGRKLNRGNFLIEIEKV